MTNNDSDSFEDSSSFWMKIFKSYVNPVLSKCSTDIAQINDLGSTSVDDKMTVVCEKMFKNWADELNFKQANRSLWRAVFRTIGFGKIFCSVTLYAVYSTLQFGPPLILNLLIEQFEGTIELSVYELYGLVALMFLIPAAGTLIQGNIIKYHLGIQARNALIGLIYRKAMRVSVASRKDTSTGQIVNLFSNDTAQILKLFSYFDYLLVCPVAIGEKPHTFLNFFTDINCTFFKHSGGTLLHLSASGYRRVGWGGLCGLDDPSERPDLLRAEYTPSHEDIVHRSAGACDRRAAGRHPGD
jgi:hypothetical protein